VTTVRVETVAPAVALVTLDRPDSLNAMSYELVRDLHAALASIEASDQYRVVVLTGAGRGFCAGFDLRDPGPVPDLVRLGPVRAQLASMNEFYGLVTRTRRMRQPVIAAVNGPAAGGGFALALAADIRVASTLARFNVAFVRVGYSACDIAVSYLLPRLIGGARAAELMLTGRIFDAEEASRIGLVHRLVEPFELVDAALDVAAAIIRNSPFGIEMTKQVMYLNVDAPSIDAAIALEQRTNFIAAATEDHDEAIAAWVERRDPAYKDR